MPKTLCQGLQLSHLWVSGGSSQRTFLENRLPSRITFGFLGQNSVLGLRLARLV